MKSNFKLMEVVCDTNVWYRLGTGQFVPDPNLRLLATENSLYELTTTFNLVTNPILVQKAVKAVFKFHYQIIPVTPFSYVLNSQSDKFQWDTSLTDKMINSFRDFASMEEEDIVNLNNKDIRELGIECQKANERNFLFQQAMNRYISDLRSRSKNDANLEYLAKRFCLTMLNDSPDSGNTRILEEDMIWEKVELFIAITSNYIGKMLKSKTMNVDENDGPDWINTLYVQPGQKYLTFDKRWNSLITADKSIHNYLVQLLC